MKKIISIFFSAAALMLFSATSNAQDPVAPSDPSTDGVVYSVPATFMDFNLDPTAAGMGNIGTVLRPTSFAMWNNMAATTLAKDKFSVGVSYGMWQPSTAGDNIVSAAGYGKIKDWVSISAGIKYFNHSAYDITDANGQHTGAYSPGDMMIGVGAAFKFLKIASVSVNLNYVYSSLHPDYVFNGVSADVAAMVDLSFLRIGLTASNFGMDIQYAEEGAVNQMPANVKLGLATTQHFGHSKKHELTVGVQAGMFVFHDTFVADAGIEYMFNNFFRVSAGYHYADSLSYIPQNVSFGLGLRVWKLHINASYLLGLESASPLTNSFSVGASIAF